MYPTPTSSKPGTVETPNRLAWHRRIPSLTAPSVGRLKPSFLGFTWVGNFSLSFFSRKSRQTKDILGISPVGGMPHRPTVLGGLFGERIQQARRRADGQAGRLERASVVLLRQVDWSTDIQGACPCHVLILRSGDQKGPLSGGLTLGHSHSDWSPIGLLARQYYASSNLLHKVQHGLKQQRKHQ